MIYTVNIYLRVPDGETKYPPAKYARGSAQIEEKTETVTTSWIDALDKSQNFGDPG